MIFFFVCLFLEKLTRDFFFFFSRWRSGTKKLQHFHKTPQFVFPRGAQREQREVNLEMSGQKILQETGEELKQVSEVQWKKSLLSEVTPCKEEKQQMANWQSVLLCQNECVRRRRKVESDERKEIRSDLIWNHKSCQKMRRSLAELCGSEKLPPAKQGNEFVLPQ